MSSADLLKPRELVQRAPELPVGVLLPARIHALMPSLLVTCDDLDGGTVQHPARGTWPDADIGDTVWLLPDVTGQLVAVAWEPA